eukprot:Pompholyxophrys_punicea_v1_NODE_925_length_1134_cov_1.885079.p3 type:complete len:112 gc:universal NODE_925_length_1134_cov_1.885079:1051-716(-)
MACYEYNVAAVSLAPKIFCCGHMYILLRKQHIHVHTPSHTHLCTNTYISICVCRIMIYVCTSYTIKKVKSGQNLAIYFAFQHLQNVFWKASFLVPGGFFLARLCGFSRIDT